ncbi:hypothetical protein BBJ28_00005264 [Nothophytophthora sp. Chile5]|nr:hypothetical protein BBJ28_00005264 [Nothophytophthora sp. Chile5]
MEEVAASPSLPPAAAPALHRLPSGMRIPSEADASCADARPRRRRVRAVAMILDDVLYDHTGLLSHLAIDRGVAQLLAERAFPTDAEAFEALQTFRNAYGLRKRFPRFVDSLVAGPQARLTPDQAQRVIAAYYESNVPEARGITPFPGARKALLELQDGGACRLALLLIGKPDVQQERLKALGVEDLFAEVVFVRANPSLAQLTTAMKELARRLDAPPSAVMFVGRKAFYEIKAANSVGMLTVRLFGKYTSVMPTDEMEQSDFQSIEQLEPIVKLADQQMLQPKIVAIGGGTGLAVLLKELRHYPADLTAVVTVFDSGRHSGALRKYLGILPPGDIRNCLVALSDSADELLSKLMNYRFRDNFMEGCSLGNLLLAALTDLQGGFDRAISSLADVLNIRGSVLPATLESTELCAELTDGSVVVSEVNVRSPFVPEDETDSTPSSSSNSSSGTPPPTPPKAEQQQQKVKKAPIKRVFLENPDVQAFQPAVRAIEEADIIVLSPGGFYTSIIATLLVPGIRDAIARSAGATVYVSNVTTQSGQTDGYTLSDTLDVLSTYLGANAIDYVIANNAQPPEDVLAPYVERGEQLLLPTPAMAASNHPVLLQGQTFQEDLVAGRVAREWQKTPMLKHSGRRVAAILYSIIDQEMDRHRPHQQQSAVHGVATATKRPRTWPSVLTAPVTVLSLLVATTLLASVLRRQ